MDGDGVASQPSHYESPGLAGKQGWDPPSPGSFPWEAAFICFFPTCYFPFSKSPGQNKLFIVQRKKKKEPPRVLQQEASSEDLFLTPSLTTPGSSTGPASSQRHTIDKSNPAGNSDTRWLALGPLSELPCRLPPSLPWDTLLWPWFPTA